MSQLSFRIVRPIPDVGFDEGARGLGLGLSQE